MTVKELKETIKNLPETMDIFIYQFDSEYTYAMAQTAEVKEVTFADGKLRAKDNCLIISDEI